ncbi:MAG: hypothetical protein WKF73_15650 [Nocardioidaceae bacterium]
MAETQTVLWMRILDRLAGPNPPKIICVDPRRPRSPEPPPFTWPRDPARTSPS